MQTKLSLILATVDKASAGIRSVSGKLKTGLVPAAEKARAALNQTQASRKLIADYRALAGNSGKLGDKLSAARAKLQALEQRQKSAKKPSATLAKQLDKQRATLRELNSQQAEYSKGLKRSQAQMRTRGIDINRLTSEEARLGKQMAEQSRGIATLQRRSERLARIRERLSRIRLPAAATGLLGAGGLYGLTRGINGTADSLDNLSKASRRLLLPIAELQALRHQAELSGVSTAEMDKGLETLSRRIGEIKATGGKGTLGSFLSQSGEDDFISQLSAAKDNAAAYQLILDKFSQIQDVQKQAAFAEMVFGRSGKKMLLMLREGTDGLATSRAELANLGALITPEQAKIAEDYNDQLHRMKMGFDAIKIQALLPILQELNNTFGDLITKLKDVDWREQKIAKLSATIRRLVDGFGWLINNLPSAVASFVAFKAVLAGISALMVANPIGAIVAAVAALSAGLVLLYENSETLRSAISSLWAGIQATPAAIKSAFGSVVNEIQSLIAGLLNNIPSFLLPSAWGEQLDQVRSSLNSLPQAPELTSRIQANIGKIGPGTQAAMPVQQSEIRLKIESDQKVTTEKADTASGVDLTVQQFRGPAAIMGY